MNRDLAFLSRRFESDLPREKAYLYKYFKTGVQEAFLKYVHVMGDHENFVDHTGFSCSCRWLRHLYSRLIHLEALHREAKGGKTEGHMALLALIEAGRYRPGRTDCRKFLDGGDEQGEDGVALQPLEVEVE